MSFSAANVAKLTEWGFLCVQRNKYYPELASSDHHTLPKKNLATGKQNLSNRNVIAVTNADFMEMNQSFYSEGIEKKV